MKLNVLESTKVYVVFDGDTPVLKLDTKESRQFAAARKVRKSQKALDRNQRRIDRALSSGRHSQASRLIANITMLESKLKSSRRHVHGSFYEAIIAGNEDYFMQPDVSYNIFHMTPVRAQGESDQKCNELAGLLGYLVLSNDSDVLLASRWIHKSLQLQKDGVVRFFDNDRIMSELGLQTREKWILMCILSGCDYYVGGIKNLGLKRMLPYFKDLPVLPPTVTLGQFGFQDNYSVQNHSQMLVEFYLDSLSDSQFGQLFGLDDATVSHVKACSRMFILHDCMYMQHAVLKTDAEIDHVLGLQELATQESRRKTLLAPQRSSIVGSKRMDLLHISIQKSPIKTTLQNRFSILNEVWNDQDTVLERQRSRFAHPATLQNNPKQRGTIILILVIKKKREAPKSTAAVTTKKPKTKDEPVAPAPPPVEPQDDPMEAESYILPGKPKKERKSAEKAPYTVLKEDYLRKYEIVTLNVKSTNHSVRECLQKSCLSLEEQGQAAGHRKYARSQEEGTKLQSQKKRTMHQYGRDSKL